MQKLQNMSRLFNSNHPAQNQYSRLTSGTIARLHRYASFCFSFLSPFQKKVVTKSADDRLAMKNRIECCSRARSKRRIDKMCDLDRYQNSQFEVNERSN